MTEAAQGQLAEPRAVSVLHGLMCTITLREDNIIRVAAHNRASAINLFGDASRRDGLLGPASTVGLTIVGPTPVMSGLLIFRLASGWTLTIPYRAAYAHEAVTLLARMRSHGWNVPDDAESDAREQPHEEAGMPTSE